MPIDEGPMPGEEEDEDSAEPGPAEFYVANPGVLAEATEHVDHWLDDRTVQELIGAHTVRNLRVLVAHAVASLSSLPHDRG